jgi:hypothetical protein
MGNGQGWQDMGFWVWVFVGVCKNPIPSKRGKGVGFCVFFAFLVGMGVKRVLSVKDLRLQQDS